MPPVTGDQLVGQTEGGLLQQDITGLEGSADIGQGLFVLVELALAGFNQPDRIAEDHAEQADPFPLHAGEGIGGHPGQKAQFAPHDVHGGPFLNHGKGGALGDQQVEIGAVLIQGQHPLMAAGFLFVITDRLAHPRPVGNRVVIKGYLGQGGTGNGVAGIALIEDPAQLAVPFEKGYRQQIVVVQQHGRGKRQHDPLETGFRADPLAGQLLFRAVQPALVGFGHCNQLFTQGHVLIDADIDQGDIVTGQRFALVQLILDGPADLDGLRPQPQGAFRQDFELIHLLFQGSFYGIPGGAVNRGEMLAAAVGGKGRQGEYERTCYGKITGGTFHGRRSLIKNEAMISEIPMIEKSR